MDYIQCFVIFSFLLCSILDITLCDPQDIFFENPANRPDEVTNKAMLLAKGPGKSCYDPNNIPGVCRKLIECPQISRIASSISVGNNLQYLQKSLCGYFGTNFVGYYCCPIPGARPQQVPQVSIHTARPQQIIPAKPLASSTLKQINNEGSNKDKVTESVGGILKIKATSPSVNSKWCGLSNVTDTRIIGGKEAIVGEWPWAALLKDITSEALFCGGALITNQHILTAAHCVIDMSPKNLQVRLREHNISSTSDGITYDIQVQRIVQHPDYDQRLNAHDLAILELKNAVYFTDRVRPICVPKFPLWKNKDASRFKGTVVGWGRKDFNDVLPSSVLKEVDLPLQPQEVCSKAYSSFKNIIINDRVFCAGDLRGSRDSCQVCQWL
ncbi:hypothetical protein QYM36_003923 [Artemia franciscana]|uniref:CLIP domain-containing serine protease n=1 Tax=Artemia franciscana TaxID=6661 RepID=A0AA88ICQ0_ARTSF|nr:hypothetical protein QYM36_003923 [Artemia franciscana]